MLAHPGSSKYALSLSLSGVVVALLVVMALSSNDFKAFVFSELAEIREEMAASARATKMCRTDLDTEYTNSAGSSAFSDRSGASEDELFATPLSEQAPEIRTMLERAAALVADRARSRGTCQRYFAILRQHYEPELQPARVESLSFVQLQELCAKLQLPPPQNLKGMAAARAAISAKCASLTEYFVTRYLA